MNLIKKSDVAELLARDFGYIVADEYILPVRSRAELYILYQAVIGPFQFSFDIPDHWVEEYKREKGHYPKCVWVDNRPLFDSEVIKDIVVHMVKAGMVEQIIKENEFL